MRTLYCPKFAGQSINSEHGSFQFDEQGFAHVGDEFAPIAGAFGGFIDENQQQEPEIPVQEAEEVQPIENADGVSVVEKTVEEQIAEVEKMTVKQLKDYAKEHEIDLMGFTKRNEILPLIISAISE